MMPGTAAKNEPAQVPADAKARSGDTVEVAQADKDEILLRVPTRSALYNRSFHGIAMEAEQINAIARLLQDVEGRAAELRRYL